ncbi:hypothetical protein MHY87_00005 [Microvirga sp. ACRRW]|uniref:hypothetical protein n=1 Tax=Microvirga sp. ACRRW TaxID=2918205 RepID=UPI001EF42092|nr:hypothetical protein [Microvirga sp. ACRRW]MCG7391291.1 hypothetical protein [Microvirga sp. ACRRW]
MANNSSAACASCRFYDDHKLNDAVAQNDRGLCRYNPPVNQPDAQGHGLWPVVDSKDWCGHFSPEQFPGE